MKLSIFQKEPSKEEDPIPQLKKVMRYEAIVQILSLLSICLLPFFIKVSEFGKQILVASIAYEMLISAYYLWQFYTFYQRLTNDNSPNLAQQLELQIEKYKAWSFQLIPIAIVIIGVIFFEKGIFNKIMADTQTFTFFATKIIVIATMMYLIGNYWLKSSYYKYANLLKGLQS